jgi:hypothetical protein
LIALYYKARYAGDGLTREEIKLLKDCYFEMTHYLRRVNRWPKYAWLRYVKRAAAL